MNKRRLAAAAVFTAFVASATMVVSAFVAATGGYFNVGEIMVYTSALLMGPVVGGFAGGFGSMIADIALGYSYFAPGTLVIKGLEGMIVGYLGRAKIQYFTKLSWRIIACFMAILVASLVWFVGVNYYSGQMDFALSLPYSSYTYSLFVPELFWILVAVLAGVLMIVAAFSVTPQVGWLTLSILAGGVEMVLGYLLYEYYALGKGVAAFAEVPVNIGQMTIGLLVGLPLARAVRKIMPQSRLEEQKTRSL